MWKNEIVEYENHLEITLYDKDQNIIGKTLVSKQHRDIVEKYKWYRKIYSDRYTDYVVATDKKGKRVRLHNLIAKKLYGEIPDGMTVDHKNRDGLDNRDENLTYNNQTFQNYNQKTRKDNTSGIKGVSQDKRGIWIAQIKYKGINLKKYFYSKDLAIEKRKYWEKLLVEKNFYLFEMEKGK